DELRVPHDELRKALATFGGVQRRFTIVAEHALPESKPSDQPVVIVDDYAHHPAEIVATLEAAQRAYGRRLVVAFQPHRYTRTHHLFDELVRAFNRADVVFLSDVYAAGEAPIEGADSASLVRAIRAHGHRDVAHVAKRADLPEAIRARLRPGDVVLTLGAGDITRTGRELSAMLAR
ncbi:MAG: UDP-N-acetylmuramate--L-alanine ligase, partial [Myxococcota bacterium]|nr:UDP-N-acetylmuramate--L-alanine ligase [Myxococcota bacterium]